MTEVDDAATVMCGCCGQSRPADEVARLNCHPDVAICGGCVDWMASKGQARPKVTPIFPVRDMGEAREFWTRAGVEVEMYDEGYAFVLADGSEVAHLCRTPRLDPERNAAACYIHVADPAVWHERWKTAGLPVTDPRSSHGGCTSSV
ncbi:MAG: hypothetical protein ACRDTE_21310 [Pseudonocardiaceae bacterium]